jgi:subtilisin-like proprotein convertase family protein
MLGVVKVLRYALVATLGALGAPAAAHATFINNASGGSITFNDASLAQNPGLATPYPSTILVEGGDGPILDVDVNVSGISHVNAQDIDLALVSPSGAKSILMSDACGTGTVTNLSVLFDESAPGLLSQNGPCTNAAFQTTDYGTGDSWPAPGPGGGLTANLANFNGNFNGSSADGTWSLFAVDDSPFPAGPQGSIASWGLEIVTSTAEITVPAKPTTKGIASPYPSEKTFNTPDGQVIDDLNLNINGFNHSFPRDVDMMLQGPTGETVMVMSDECSGDDIADSRPFTFDDEAPLGLTSDPASCNGPTVITKPSDRDDVPENGPENMPAPAPPRPYGSTMSVFDGLPGGTFRLFINDATTGDTGFISGWNVTMTTRPPAATGFAANAVATAEGQTAQLIVNRTGSSNLGAAAMKVAVTDGETDSKDFAHAVPATLQFARGETTKTIAIPITKDFDAEGPETFQVALANATGDAKLANATAKVTIARSEPDNRFTLGKAIRKRNGSAQIPVTIPGPGQLTSDDAGAKDLLKAIGASAQKPGTTMLKVKPAKRTKRKLKRGKKVKLTASVTFTPDGGSANSKQAPVTLKRK